MMQRCFRIIGSLFLFIQIPSFGQQIERFTFSDVDLAMLEQVELLDKKYDKDGMSIMTRH